MFAASEKMVGLVLWLVIIEHSANQHRHLILWHGCSHCSWHQYSLLLQYGILEKLATIMILQNLGMHGQFKTIMVLNCPCMPWHVQEHLIKASFSKLFWDTVLIILLYIFWYGFVINKYKGSGHSVYLLVNSILKIMLLAPICPTRQIQ